MAVELEYLFDGFHGSHRIEGKGSGSETFQPHQVG